MRPEHATVRAQWRRSNVRPERTLHRLGLRNRMSGTSHLPPDWDQHRLLRQCLYGRRPTMRARGRGPDLRDGRGVHRVGSGERLHITQDLSAERQRGYLLVPGNLLQWCPALWTRRRNADVYDDRGLPGLGLGSDVRSLQVRRQRVQDDLFFAGRLRHWMVLRRQRMQQYLRHRQ